MKCIACEVGFNEALKKYGGEINLCRKHAKELKRFLEVLNLAEGKKFILKENK
jgi:hypothetical protein